MSELRPNLLLQRTASPLAERERVCRAWHESSRVKVLASGISRAEG